jgi:hypothetical protein
MLTDPDSPFDEWQTEVSAATMAEARAKCSAIIETFEFPIELDNVSQRTKTKRDGQYKFVCWFKVEDSYGDNSNSPNN